MTGEVGLIRTVDELSRCLSDQLERFWDDDSDDWSAAERARQIWTVVDLWDSEGDLLDAVALLAVRKKVRWSPKKGFYDGLVRLAYPRLDPQRWSELTKVTSRIGRTAHVERGGTSVKDKMKMLKKLGGVDQSTRKKNGLSNKRIMKAVGSIEKTRQS